MLFLKIFDQSEDGWADDARDQGRTYRSALPEPCRWRKRGRLQRRRAANPRHRHHRPRQQRRLSAAQGPAAERQPGGTAEDARACAHAKADGAGGGTVFIRRALVPELQERTAAPAACGMKARLQPTPRKTALVPRASTMWRALQLDFGLEGRLFETLYD